MKIRNGFVSNSSSSSFHIYGTEVDEYDIKQLLIDDEIATQKDVDDYGIEEFIHLLKWDGLQYHCVRDWSKVFVGRSYSGIGDSETGGEFKEDATNRVSSFFGKKMKCESHFETYYS